MTDHRLSAGADSIGAGAPADENEITPAMIAAGVSALLDFDSRFEKEADVVVDIFCAMMAAKEGPCEAPEGEMRDRQTLKSESVALGRTL